MTTLSKRWVSSFTILAFLTTSLVPLAPVYAGRTQDPVDQSCENTETNENSHQIGCSNTTGTIDQRIEDIRSRFESSVRKQDSSQERKIDVCLKKDAGGSGNEGIYEIIEDNKYYIYKISISIDQKTGYLDEKENIERIIYKIQEFNERTEFPKFARYIQDRTGDINKKILFFEKAEGKLLYNFIKEDLKDMPVLATEEHIKVIGNLLGSFHNHEVTLNQKKMIVEGWTHGDLSCKNIFYNQDNKELIFIDYDKLKKNKKPLLDETRKIFKTLNIASQEHSLEKERFITTTFLENYVNKFNNENIKIFIKKHAMEAITGRDIGHDWDEEKKSINQSYNNLLNKPRSSSTDSLNKVRKAKKHQEFLENSKDSEAIPVKGNENSIPLPEGYGNAETINQELLEENSTYSEAIPMKGNEHPQESPYSEAIAK